MNKFLIGRSPITSLAGYILAVLFVIRDLNTAGIHRWQDYLLPATLALFGRLAGDDSGNHPRPPCPTVPPANSKEAHHIKQDSFLRHGKFHTQRRERSGRFATSTA